MNKTLIVLTPIDYWDYEAGFGSRGSPDICIYGILLVEITLVSRNFDYEVRKLVK